MKPNKRSLLIILLSLVTAAAIGVSIWALFLRDTASVLAPDYAPQETEQNAEPIADDDTSRLDSPEGGGAVSLTYSREVTVDLSDRKVTLLFANPAKSTQNMVVQIVIDDVVVVQSGSLLPGNQVTTLELLPDAEKRLAAGGYDGRFVVLYYNQQSGEKAMVNTEIPLTVTVTE